MRTPVTLYLFHLVRQALDGRRLVVWMDEFAKLLGGSGVRGLRARRAQDLAQVERGGGVCDAVAVGRAGESDCADAGRADADQGAVPELEAQRAEYVEGFGLSEREFELVGRELTPGSRRFLVKQGVQGSCASSILQGFEPSSR